MKKHTEEVIELSTQERIELIGVMNDLAELLIKMPDKTRIKALIIELECVGLHQRAREMRELIGE